MPKIPPRGRPVLPIAAAAALLIAGAGLPAEAASANSLVRGYFGPLETLDPQKAATAAETAIVLDLFEGLVTTDASGAPVPGAAQSWTLSADGLSYRFTLRDTARWSNGEAVKAEDFVASFRRLFDPATGATEDDPLLVIKGARRIKSGLAGPETLGVEAPDDRTLVIQLETPTPTFIARLALPAALPVNVAAARRLGTDFVKGDRLVGNGAYRLAAPRGPAGLMLTAEKKSRSDTVPPITTVRWQPFETAADCLAAFRAGTVDICPDAPVEALADLKTDLGSSLRIAPYAGSYFYVFDTRKPPFDDARVRRALSLAVDRDAIATKVWSGGMTAADSLVPPGLRNMAAGEKKPLDARQDEARALLQQAGFGSQKPLAVSIDAGGGLANEKTAALVAAAWRAIGVDAKVEADDGQRHFTALSEGRSFDVTRSGWIADEADALAMLTVLRSDSRFNYGRYANPLFDTLTAKAAVETNEALRHADLAGAEAILANDAPIVPLFAYASLNLVSPRVTGFLDNPLDRHPSRTLALSP